MHLLPQPPIASTGRLGSFGLPGQVQLGKPLELNADLKVSGKERAWRGTRMKQKGAPNEPQGN